MSDVDRQNITREELLARYNAGGQDLRGVILQYISLDGVKLVKWGGFKASVLIKRKSLSPCLMDKLLPCCPNSDD